MTEDEVEFLAQELARIGGISWYPGRSDGPLLRTVSERFRDRARVAIAAIDRFRARKGEKKPRLEIVPTAQPEVPEHENQLPEIGAVVVYRPPGERRAISCRVADIKNGRVCLVPLPMPDIGWVSLDTLKVEGLRGVS